MRFENCCFNLLLLLLCAFFCNGNQCNSLDCTKEDILENDELANLINYNATYPRLSNASFPLSYELNLTTQIHKEIFNFYANCTIRVEVRENTNYLVLHASNLTIYKVRVKDDESPGTKHLKVNQFNDSYTDLLVIYCKSKTNNCFQQNHRYEIYFSYEGKINKNQANGFYAITYENTQQLKVYGAVTHFEPIFARKVLPCYDEPGYKANFILSITHGKNFSAISNMPQKGDNIESDDDMVTTSFYETPLMPSYLLAFAVTNYVNISTKDDLGDLRQRLFLPPGIDAQLGIAKVALKNAQQIIKTLEQHLEVPYALPKMDHFYMNESFGTAMENWGLITYSIKKVLNGNKADLKTIVDELIVQTHELAHQWFGNLVTPNWWSHIWLNEGFATYYSYIIASKLFPEYQIMDYFQIKVCDEVMTSVKSEETINANISDHNEILSNAFGFNAYYKAPCIIRMMEHALGENIFQKGISNYLKKFSYKNVDENDLFEMLQETAKDHYQQLNKTWAYDIREIFSSWTNSKFLPYVTITRNYENEEITFQQKSIEVFDAIIYENENDEITFQQKSIEDDRKLWIPINIATTSQPSFDKTKADFFLPPVPSFTITANALLKLNISLQKDDWLFVNVQGKGMYKVIYDAENMRRILKSQQTNFTSLPLHARAFLLQSFEADDYWQSVETVEMLLEFLKIYESDKHPLVFEMFLGLAFNFINFQPDVSNLKKYFFKTNANAVYRLIQSKTNPNVLERYISQLMDDYYPSFVASETVRNNELDNIVADNFIDLETPKRFSQPLCVKAKNLTDEQFNKWQHFTTRPEYIEEKNKEFNWYDLTCTRSDKQYTQLFEYAVQMNGNHSCRQKFDFFVQVVKVYPRIKNITFPLLEKSVSTLVQNSAEVCLKYFHKELIRIAEYYQKYKKQETFSYVKLQLTNLINMLEESMDSSNNIRDSSKESSITITNAEAIEITIQNWIEAEIELQNNAESTDRKPYL